MNAVIAKAEVTPGTLICRQIGGVVLLPALTVIDRDITFSGHIRGMESPKTADDG
jgi:hypothetical protein